jgi:hypothetical protein
MYLTGQAKMSIQNKILIVLIILMMGASSVFFYLIYQDKKAITQKPETTTEKKAEVQKNKKTYPEDLTGKVYLTLREKDSDKQGIYYFDLDRNELVEVYTSTECEIIGGGLNSIGNKMAYSSNCEQENQDHYQTFLLDLSTKNKKALNETKGGIEKGAVFSADDKIIANMTSIKNEEKPDFVNWFIFTNDLEGNGNFVATNSISPAFSKDNNKILGLRKEGLYLYDVENQQGKAVLNLGVDKNHLTLKYDWNDQKNKLALFDNISESKGLIIYEIESQDDFILNEIEKIDFSQNERISSLKFSSIDDGYVVIKKINYDENKSELVVYDIETKENYSILDLSEYKEDNQALVNDWK